MLCYFCMHEKGEAVYCPYCGKSGIPHYEPHHLPPGTMLRDRYIVGRVLGEGGFGTTYIGYNRVFDVVVAIKEYFPNGYSQRNNTLGGTVSVVGNKELYDKGKSHFLHEAKTLAKLHKEPGIVSVTDFLEQNNTAYIVMEYLDGINLKTYLKTHGVLNPEQAFRMLMPMMESLEKIHRNGVIHRDISPDNIMMLADNTLKLMDFGAARDYVDDNKSLSVVLKQGYAPEEQYRRKGEQGPWTDVYALCATIYRCIVGKPPTESVERLYEDTLKKPSDLGIAISPRLENVLLYGLAVRKENRCPDMATLLNMTRSAIDAQTGAVTEPQYAVNQTQDDYQTVLQSQMPVRDYPAAGAPDTYQTQNTVLEQNPVVSQMPVMPQTYQPETAPIEMKKKSPKALIISLASVVLVGVIAAILIIIFSNKPAKSAEERSASSVKTSESSKTESKLSESKEEMGSDEKNYQTAEEYFQAGNYENAKNYYLLAGGYSNSGEMVNECDYQIALGKMESDVTSEVLSAIRTFESLGDYSDSSTQLSKAKLKYCELNQDNSDQTTYTYLKELKEEGNSSAESMYEDLYSWKLTDPIWNTDSEDNSTNMSEISKYKTLYFHFLVSGGTPGSSIQLKYKFIEPDGDSNMHFVDGTSEDGSDPWISFSYDVPQNGMAGTLIIKIYDEDDNELLSSSVELIN